MRRVKLSLILMLSLLVTGLAHATTLKIATLSPEGSAWMNTFRAASERIKEETSGRVKIKFYPGGVMGDDEAVLKKMRIRQLHGSAMTGGSLFRFFSDGQIYSLPVAFENLEQVDHVRAELDSVIVDGFEQGGLVTFGLAGGGFAYIMSKHPISHPDHVKSRKTWAPSDDAATVAAFDAFSISPIPLPIGDVLAGMQTGLIDTIAASPVAAVTLQWHTQIKYVTKLPLIYIYAVLAIDGKAFARLKQEDAVVVRKHFTDAFKSIDTANRSDNNKALAALASQGIEILEPSPEELAEWKRLGEQAGKAMVASGALSQGMVDKLQNRLASF